MGLGSGGRHPAGKEELPLKGRAKEVSTRSGGGDSFFFVRVCGGEN